MAPQRLNLGPRTCRRGSLTRQFSPSPNGAPTYQRELVGHLAVWWDFGSEAIGREEFVAVVILDDFPNGLQRHGVRAELVRAHVVERSGLGGIPCEKAFQLVLGTLHSPLFQQLSPEASHSQHRPETSFHVGKLSHVTCLTPPMEIHVTLCLY